MNSKTKTKSFKYYALFGLFYYALCISGWLYIDYNDHKKWSNWQNMVASGKHQPIKVKLTHIAKIEETSSRAPYEPGYFYKTPTFTHNQGWLRDSNGVMYKAWISHAKVSTVDTGRTYELYKLGNVTIVPAFIDNKPKQYVVSETAKGAFGIISVIFLIYFIAMYFTVKSNTGKKT